MAQNRKDYDFVVIGGGTMGLSTALYLHMQCPEAKTAIVQQYEFGHEEGASHSQTRVIRSTYFNEFFRDLAVEAKEFYWPEVQSLLNQKLVTRNPYLAFIQQKAQAYAKYKRTADTSKTTKIISAQEAHDMYPFIPKVNTCQHVFYEEDAGIILSMKYLLGAAQYLKKCKKMDVYEKTQLITYQNCQSGVTLKLKSQTQQLQIHTKKAAFCCGHWLNKLVPKVNPLITNIKQVVTYWRLKNSQEYKIGRFPTFVHVQECGDYNFVLPDGADGDVKYMVSIADPKYWDRSFSSDEEFQRTVLEYMSKKMAYHYGENVVGLTKKQTCWYSITENECFLIDWTDQHRNTLVVSPCSGQGFKFSPVVGKIVKDLLQKDKSIPLFEKFRYLSKIDYHYSLKDNKAA